MGGTCSLRVAVGGGGVPLIPLYVGPCLFNYFSSGLLWAGHFNATVNLFILLRLSTERWLPFKLARSTCQMVFKTGAAAVPVHHLHTVIYHTAQKFLSAKHLADQKRQVSLLPGFQTEGK